MNLSQENIYKIRSEFSEMQTPEDLRKLMNKVGVLIYANDFQPIKKSTLSFYSSPFGQSRFVKTTDRYHSFTVKKKSGGDRLIHAPNSGLKKIQSILSILLQCIFIPNKAAKGFVWQKSIVDNANVHVGNYYVYNIDIKDFFPSIDQARVWKCLQLQPFYLCDNYNSGINDNNVNGINSSLLSTNKKSAMTLERVKFSRLKIANMIANLSCTEMEVDRLNENGNWIIINKNVLPQGAPTSPVLTNVVCQRLDYLLTAVAKRFGLKYSRYADDITFSSLHNVFQKDSPFLTELDRIIRDQGFSMNQSKTRLQVNGMRKEVTGLLVNEKVNVQKRYIKQLRMWLYYWDEYGYEKASDIFIKDYKKDKAHNPINESISFKSVLHGKLNFLRMVKGVEDSTYVKLKNRYVKLAKDLKIKQKLEQRKKDEARYIKLREIIGTLPKRNEDDLENLVNDLLLKGELNRLERKLNIKKKLLKKTIKRSNNNLPEFHRPKDLVSLLKNFSKNESSLKYLTHSWDIGREEDKFQRIQEFLTYAAEDYSKIQPELNELNKQLNAMIRSFVFNPNVSEDGWGPSKNKEERIRFGWSSPELNSACEEDIDLNPEDFILPSKYQLSKNGKTLHKFKHIIEYFKKQIEIRDENSALVELILEKHDKYLAQEKFKIHDIESLENKTFYTYVPFFSKALDYIFSSILKRKQHPNISYKVHRKENGYELEILQLGSFNEYKSYEDEKLNIDGGDFGSIAYYLKNLCDWSIESKFKEGAFRINFLTSDKDKPAYEKINSAEGFKYILIFYK